jgi:hypothetical protein
MFLNNIEITHLKIIFGYTASIIALVAYGLYIRNILINRTKPHAFSWLLWGLLTGIIFVAQILKGGGAGAWVTGVSSVACFLIGFLAFFKDNRGFLYFDWIFLGAALAALSFWFFVKDITLSVIIVTLVDVLGYASTLRKGWHKPGEDMITSFGLNSIKFIFSILALSSYSIATWFYPAWMIIMNGLVVVVLVTRRNKLLNN